ncbi:PKD domain-containing protein, partial [candidate division GN15 bacterium]|nr:PKD domain-containing protein [candidate division GN15 bacterium]
MLSNDEIESGRTESMAIRSMCSRRLKPADLLAQVIVVLMAASVWAAAPQIDDEPFWISGEDDLYHTGMMWRDYNNDGFIDVFFSNGNDIVLAPNTLYLSQNGQLPTSATWSSSNAEYSGHCAVGDIDDDGYADFVVANFLGADGFSQPNQTNLYFNQDGVPSLTPDWESSDSHWSFSCAVGDVDNDGDMDVAVATGEAYTGQFQPEKVYFNIGGALETSPSWQSSQLTAALDVFWADIDNNGYLDLIVAADLEGLLVYYNSSAGLETTPGWQMADPAHVNTVIAGDVNGDGWLDIIAAHNNQISDNGHFAVHLNDGAGTPSASPDWESSTEGNGSALALYDYDRDGDMDLAAGRWWDAPRVYENLGTTFTASPVWQSTVSTVVEQLAWVDVDAGGVESLADTLSGDGSRTLFYTSKSPLYSVDSVVSDGINLGWPDYCYDLFSGWVSLSSAPVSDLEIYYRYSYNNDLAMSNWDTANMVYANQQPPLVNFAAAPALGFVPLDVQFSDSSIGATGWQWQFGDGETSGASAPLHQYTQPGAYDVTLTVELPDGSHTRTALNRVVALADTLKFADVYTSPGEPITIEVLLRNQHPMQEFILPFTWDGPIQLNYTGFDTIGCRTAGFEKVELVSFDGFFKRAAFRFQQTQNGSGEGMAPGYGKILNIHFAHNSGTGSQSIDTTSFSDRQLELIAGYATYTPRVIQGTLEVSDVACGDINGDGEGPNVADLTYFVNYLFAGGTPPPSLWAANVNGMQPVNISDLTYMVA